MKSKRHEKILELISRYEIETQEELAERLNQCGFHVTQATISRDIRQLRLSKIGGHDGKQRYATMNVGDKSTNDKLSRVLREGYISSMEASRLLVVRTMPGMAMAVASALDAMELSGFAGCIAGDDAIICALCSDEDVRELMTKIDKVVQQ